MKNMCSYIKKHPTILSIIIVNLYPLYGILSYDWNILFIVLLYWIEGIIFGFYTALKIIIAKRTKSDDLYIAENQYRMNMVNLHFNEFSLLAIGKYPKQVIFLCFIAIFLIYLILGLPLYAVSFMFFDIPDSGLIMFDFQKLNLNFIPVISLFIFNYIILFCYDYIYKKQYIDVCIEKIIEDFALKLLAIFVLIFTIQFSVNLQSPVIALMIFTMVKIYFEIYYYRRDVYFTAVSFKTKHKSIK